MKHWPAIAALGLMAGLVAFVIGAAFASDPGIVLTPQSRFQAFALAALFTGLWWTGWTLLLLAKRKERSNSAGTRPLPLSNLALAIWFVVLTGLGTNYATHHFVPL